MDYFRFSPPQAQARERRHLCRRLRNRRPENKTRQSLRFTVSKRHHSALRFSFMPGLKNKKYHKKVHIKASYETGTEQTEESNNAHAHATPTPRKIIAKKFRKGIIMSLNIYTGSRFA
jgi:hypothetical protein